MEDDFYLVEDRCNVIPLDENEEYYYEENYEDSELKKRSMKNPQKKKRKIRLKKSNRRLKK